MSRNLGKVARKSTPTAPAKGRKGKKVGTQGIVRSIARRILGDPKLSLDTDYGSVELGMDGFDFRGRRSSGNSVVVSQPLNESNVLKPYLYSSTVKTRMGNARRIWGRQVLCNVQETNGTAQNLSGISGGATLSNVGGLFYIYLNPDNLNGNLALEARVYNKFRFRQVMVHATMGQGGTSTLRNMNVVCYMEDPSFTSYATPTYSQLASVDNCMLFNSWQNTNLALNLKDDPSRLWFTQLDSGSSPNTRQCAQGAIFGVASAIAGATTLLGELWISYVIDLHDRASDYGFTLSVSEPERLYKLMAKEKELWELLCPNDQRRLNRLYGATQQVEKVEKVQYRPKEETPVPMEVDWEDRVERKSEKKPDKEEKSEVKDTREQKVKRAEEPIDFGDVVVINDGWSRSTVRLDAPMKKSSDRKP